jgi:hypothetical protein
MLSASRPSRVVSPRPSPGALRRHTPGACQTSVRISPRHPAADNNYQLGIQHLQQIDYSRASTTHLHPLLGLAHRFHVTSYHRRVDKVVCQEFNPTTTTRGGSRHWHRADWLRILDLRRTDDNFYGGLWQYIIALLSGGRGGSPLATSMSSGASSAAPWVSGAWPSMGTASGIALPSASAPVNK